jgi:glycine hydroxymethyltransferase
MKDYLFRGKLSEIDPSVYELAELEAERQIKKLILIPSESQAPLAVREALSSAFQNIYAEGYPDEDTRQMTEDEILDYKNRLGEYRRYSDPRYYKGVEYADFMEELARRRCAEAFAANGVKPEEIYVNVQALSGAPANNAVYHALVNPGDTIMGMNLLHGGHLSHGSSVNRSGQYYNAIHYNIDPVTEQIDYDEVEALAKEHKPKFIIAGYSSYPWQVDWERFRDIAHSVGAYLFADIAHVAGLVAGGAYPSPIGIADVITFTTHKSLCGPRGACILTTNRLLARKIDRAVFPGEQGGPHVNVFAAMALTFKLAKTEQFRELQQQIVKNCKVFTDKLSENGFRIPFGGTNTHLMNLDCTTIKSADGSTLSGDMAARILDIAGIVCNRNTIPGDKSALDPSGIRMGTPWLTQRGFKEEEMIELANIISDLLKATIPYTISGKRRKLRRAKVDFATLEDAKIKVRSLALSAGTDFEPSLHGYPHFYYMDKTPSGKLTVYEIGGEKVLEFINYAFSSDVESLQLGAKQSTRINLPKKEVTGTLRRVTEDVFRLTINSSDAGETITWLRDLSDGYIHFDEDVLRKIPGPVWIVESENQSDEILTENPIGLRKPYFIGIKKTEVREVKGLPEFKWEETEAPLRRTPIYDTHKKLGAKVIPFAGWEMPVWYTSVLEEHNAVRNAAGLFDVAHMGVYQVEGAQAVVFLDSVVGNDISALRVGESCYTHLLNPDGDIIDDLLVYHRSQDKYLMVVNASNDDKDWAWLNAVKNGEVLVSREHPFALAYGRDVTLRNLRNPKEGKDMRVDIALQGPRSRDILLNLGVDRENEKRIKKLKRTELCEAVVGGFDLVVSRTGYTGEKMAFELFVHPNQAEKLFSRLLEVGESYGIKPVGLGARDSLRTEAGLPLYGHEMGAGSGKLGARDLGVADAGFESYVKTYKPWFIGRESFIEQIKNQKGVVVRFRFETKGVKMAHNGDPVVNKRGKVIGWVTSCAVDSDSLLTGQAYVDLKDAVEGTVLYIYQGAPKKGNKPPAEFNLGDKSLVPTPAKVIRRFPK